VLMVSYHVIFCTMYVRMCSKLRIVTLIIRKGNMYIRIRSLEMLG
jgi:hypothetical protein